MAKAQLTVEESVDIIGENYPHVSDKLHALWGSKECEVYLRGLVFDDRGSRSGFPIIVFRAILRLYDYHTNVYDYSDPDDVWLNRK